MITLLTITAKIMIATRVKTSSDPTLLLLCFLFSKPSIFLYYYIISNLIDVLNILLNLFSVEKLLLPPPLEALFTTTRAWRFRAFRSLTSIIDCTFSLEALKYDSSSYFLNREKNTM